MDERFLSPGYLLLSLNGGYLLHYPQLFFDSQTAIENARAARRIAIAGNEDAGELCLQRSE